MSKIKVNGHDTEPGVITIEAPNTSTDRTITLPDATGTLLNSDGDGSSLTGTGKVLQVVSTTKTDTFSSSSSTWTDVTGLSVTITPAATSSKVRIAASISGTGLHNAVQSQLRLVRDSTAINIGDAAGSRTQATFGQYAGAPDGSDTSAVDFIDSPSTTSATVYKIQMRLNSSTGYINRSSTDSDTSAYYRTTSTITVMEIGA